MGDSMELTLKVGEEDLEEDDEAHMELVFDSQSDAELQT